MRWGIRSKLLVVAVGMGLACAHALPAAAQSLDTAYAPVSVSVEATRLGDTNAYYVPALSGVPDEENEGHTANAGFAVTDEGVVVYDALGTPSLGAAMLESIRQVTDQPIVKVIASHYHADHVYGLQIFQDHTEAEIIAQAQAQDYVDSEQAQRRLEQRREALAPWVNQDTRVVAPDTLFGTQMDFELGGSRFSLLHAGPAHAPDDAMMLVEPAGVLFSGDIVQDGRVPFLASESIDSGQWLAAIEQVRSMEPAFMVPGHGRASPDPMPALAFTHGYISDVRAHMRAAVRDWIPFEEAYAQADWSEYEDLPAFEASHKRNAYSVYLELERAELE